jgi:hypothetical protein
MAEMARDSGPRPGRFTNGEPIPPARRVSPVVIQRFDDVYEVDPELMRDRFRQQEMPAWDTLRIVAARHGHVGDIHAQFADSVILAGEDSEIADEPPSPARSARDQSTEKES